ncbi:MAG: metallophosphoesterase family protein [Victivallales bacterium]
MRYAIVSDLHANKPALKSVLADIASSQIDQIICLGDVVGYGPNPAEVLELAYSKIHHFILGNHDAVIGGKLSAECFNDNAKRLRDWTNRNLDGKAAKFFNSLPLDAKGENFRCAHAEFANPGRFGYVLDPADAEESFKSCPEQLLFVGHSHVPGLFVMGDSRVAHWLEPVDFGIEDGKRYIVNVGSVGQPRDDGIKACYCIFDTEQKDVLFKKAAFDIEEYISDQKRNKLPESPTYFIDIYHKQAPRPIRDIIDFHRVSPEKSVKSDVETVELHKTVAKLRKTKLILLVLLLICSAVLFVLVFGYSRQKTAAEKAKYEADKTNIRLNEVSQEVKKYKKTVFPAANQGNAAMSSGQALKANLISMPEKEENGTVSAGKLLKDWTVSVTEPEMQRVAVESFEDKSHGGMQIFRTESGKPLELCIISPAVAAEKGMLFSGNAQFKREKIESGYIELVLEQELPDGTRKILGRNIAEEVNKSNSWNKGTAVTMKKNEALTESGKVRLMIRGQFTGEILARKCGLKRTE